MPLKIQVVYKQVALPLFSLQHLEEDAQNKKRKKKERKQEKITF